MSRSSALVLVLAFGCAEKPAQQATLTPAKVDPYPECKAVREWLEQNLHDPRGLEIIGWKRLNASELGLPAGSSRIDVKFRAMNQFGGKSVDERSLFFRGRKLVGETP